MDKEQAICRIMTLVYRWTMVRWADDLMDRMAVGCTTVKVVPTGSWRTVPVVWGEAEPDIVVEVNDD